MCLKTHACLRAYILFISLLVGVMDTYAQPSHKFEPALRARVSDLQDGIQVGGAASMLLRATFQSNWTDTITTEFELDHVETALQGKHSDGLRFNGKPEIPDVPGTEINQAYLSFSTQDWRFHIGRQVIELGNERFIGSVGAWQNEQSFDAFILDGRFASRSSFKYGYINKAHRIFGNDAGPALSENDMNFVALGGQRPLARLGEHAHQTHFFSLDYKEWDYWEWRILGLSLTNEDVTSLDSTTLGFKVGFQKKPDLLQWRAEFEWAGQKYDRSSEWIPYYRIKAGLEYESHELSLNGETLDRRGDRRFTTSLASNHEFQGWADVFGSLPSGGVRDVFLKYSWRGRPWKIDLRWHYFSDLNHNNYLGQEFDADLVFKPQRQHLLLLRLARYAASTRDGPGSEDRQRVILSYTYSP